MKLTQIISLSTRCKHSPLAMATRFYKHVTDKQLCSENAKRLVTENVVCIRDAIDLLFSQISKY